MAFAGIARDAGIGRLFRWPGPGRTVQRRLRIFAGPFPTQLSRLLCGHVDLYPGAGRRAGLRNAGRGHSPVAACGGVTSQFPEHAVCRVGRLSGLNLARRI